MNDFIQSELFNLISILNNSDNNIIKNYLNNNNNNIYSLLNTCDYNNVYPIHYLLINKKINFEILDLILEKGSKLTYCNEFKNIIYYILKFQENKKEYIDYLVTKNFNFNFKDKFRYNIFHYLSFININLNDNVDYLLTLCDYKNLIDSKDTAIGSSPLLLSTQFNNNKITNKLIELKCDINNYNKNNNNALMYTCMYSNLNLTKKLIDLKADINHKDNQNDIAVFYACGCDNKNELNLDLIKYLIEKKADINGKNAENNTVLHYAAGINNDNIDFKILDYLLSIKIDANSLTNQNNTFIDVIIDNELEDTTELIELIQKYNLMNNININNCIIQNFYKNKDFDKLIKLNLMKLENETECLICRDELNDKSRLVKCINNHYYDIECLIESFKHTSDKKCPLCLDIIDYTYIFHL